MNQIPNNHTRITSFNAPHRLSVSHVIRWYQTWKTPAHHVVKAEEFGDAAELPKLYVQQ